MFSRQWRRTGGRQRLLDTARFSKLRSGSSSRYTLCYQYCIYIMFVSVFLATCSTIFLVFSMMTGSYDAWSITSQHERQHPSGAVLSDGSAVLLPDRPSAAAPHDNKPNFMNAALAAAAAHEKEQEQLAVVTTLPPRQSLGVEYRLYTSTNCDETNPDSYIHVSFDESNGDNRDFFFCKKKFVDDTRMEPQTVQSIRIVSGNADLDLYSDCQFNRYHSSIFTFDQCQHLYAWPPTRGIRVVEPSLTTKQAQPLPLMMDQRPMMQPHVIEMLKNGEMEYPAHVPTYRIVYSGESSEYMGYQAQSNYYGFLTSGQHRNGRFTRLQTSSEIDDIADYVPTFTAKRHPYSRRYGPLNKADVLVKWFESEANSPKEEIIVVIDPDNWIIKDISNWVAQAKEGMALGEAAWFHGSQAVTNLWKEVCLQNCDWELDMVGVPYVVHREDLKKIAPWFRKYILLMKEREEVDKEFLNRYKGIQMGWGTEMFGYIFAAAHVGIKHNVVRGIQLRDVSARPRSVEEEKSYSMIHMGRAWFPANYEPAKQWAHTEGKAWHRFGTQVWCKCNYTASDIIPWPMPPDTDYQSRHTLYLLHESRQFFGEIPKNKFRKSGYSGYHEPYP